MGKSPPRDPAQEQQALQDTLYVVGGKWKLPIINALCNGQTRFRDIQRAIPRITTRMLSKELKELELNQLLTRTVHDDFPARVEYELTPYCHTLGVLLQEMIKWGIKHRQLR